VRASDERGAGAGWVGGWVPTNHGGKAGIPRVGIPGIYQGVPGWDIPPFSPFWEAGGAPFIAQQ